MKRRGLLLAVGLGLGALAYPMAAAAHGLVGRTDLPIPVWLFGWTASAVLIVSFVALSALWQQPRLQETHARPLFRLPRVVDVVLGAFGVFVLVAVVYSGFEGSPIVTANLAPTVIYVHFWVGLVILSVLFGDVFRLLSPWRAIVRGWSWAARRLPRGGPAPPLSYPRWLGRWPAALGILAFAWLELVYLNKDDPKQLAWIAVAYTVIQLVGMGLFGIEAWSENGDAFGVYFGLFARLSIFERHDGTIYRRRALSGAPPMPVVPGGVALLFVALGSTTFDGFSNGDIWKRLEPHIQNLFSGAGLTASLELAFTVGLLACILIVAGFYQLGVRGILTVDTERDGPELARRFAHTLIPIAFAYALAHYFSLLVYQGQAIGYLASDPLGNGSNIFGTANLAVNYGVISAAAIWYVQVAALVGGHVGGLTLAHDRALAMYTRVDQATRSQYWMLVVMVGFTCLGLWLLSAVSV